MVVKKNQHFLTRYSHFSYYVTLSSMSTVRNTQYDNTHDVFRNADPVTTSGRPESLMKSLNTRTAS